MRKEDLSMKPYAFNIRLPSSGTQKTVVARAMTLEDAWRQIEENHPGAVRISVTWPGKE